MAVLPRSRAVTAMPALKNIGRERFAQLLTCGQSQQDRASQEHSVPTREREKAMRSARSCSSRTAIAAYAAVVGDLLLFLRNRRRRNIVRAVRLVRVPLNDGHSIGHDRAAVDEALALKAK